MRKLTFEMTYENFLDATGRRESGANLKLWLNIVALVNSEHYDVISEELHEAISLLANDDV